MGTMNSPLLRRIASAVVAILLFIYMGYQIYNSHYAKVQTETASYASTADTVQVTGTAVRKEKLMNTKVNGVITYSISDGGKVAKGGTVAKIYPNEQSAAAQQQIADLDYQISKLQKLLTITPAEFKEKQKEKPAGQSGSAGKICEDYDWYFACLAAADKASKFKEGDAVSIQFPFASNQTVPATVAAVNQADKDTEAVVILQSSSMNSSLALIRNATAQIQIEKYTGIRVSQKAIHFAKVTKTGKDSDGKATSVTREVKGVYVMHGSEIEFRQIFPLFSTANYAICQTDPPKEDLMTDSTVKLFDEVVVEGTDLYDGKVVK